MEETAGKSHRYGLQGILGMRGHGSAEVKGVTLDIHHSRNTHTTYAATVWWPEVKYETSSNNLRKL
jgi:hypothetical protein